MTRFSQFYLAPATLSDDSDRMRVRLSELYTTLVPFEHRSRFLSHARLRLGLRDFNRSGLFDGLPLPDVMDLITVVYEWIRRSSPHNKREKVLWKEGVERIFREEHVRYTVDDNCNVRFFVDEEFERNFEASVSALGSPRYKAALTYFRKASDALSRNPPDGREALRQVFESTEATFKLFFNKSPRLTGGELNAYLKATVKSRYGGDEKNRDAAEKMLESFKAWVDAMQNYRHAQGQPEPHQPALEVAVLGVSTGASFLRWLLEFDPNKEV